MHAIGPLAKLQEHRAALASGELRAELAAKRRLLAPGPVAAAEPESCVDAKSNEPPDGSNGSADSE